MTFEQFKVRFPQASYATYIRNAGIPNTPERNHTADSPVPSAKPERVVRAKPLGKEKDKGRNPTRILVRVTSFRRRLLDEDNLCEKYFVDCCRYAGLIPDDTAAKTKIEVVQEKVESEDQERTEIEITK